MAEHDFTLEYRPGKMNGDADALSRRPQPDCSSESEGKPHWLDWVPPAESKQEVLTSEELIAVCQSQLVDTIPGVEAVCAASSAVPLTVAEPSSSVGASYRNDT